MKLYLGVKIGDEHEETVRGYLRNFNDMKAFEVMKTIPEDRLHVTVLFLGEVAEAQAIRIAERARWIAPFDCFVGEAMGFGSDVLVLRVYGSGLLVLNRWMKDAYAAEFGKPLRSSYAKYVPHLTIAKNETRQRDSSYDCNLGVASLVNSPMMPFTVSRLGLYHKSELIHEVGLLGQPAATTETQKGSRSAF